MSEARVVPITPRPAGITADSLHRIDKGPVLASVDLSIPAWHIKLSSCLWMSKDNREWIALPTKSFKNHSGKIVYQRLIEFTDDVTAERFQTAALAAVRYLLRDVIESR